MSKLASEVASLEKRGIVSSSVEKVEAPPSPLTASDRKYSLPANINQELKDDDDESESALSSIQSAVHGHVNRSMSLSALKTGPGRIHIARPWLKKKVAVASMVAEESSEEEADRMSIQSILRAHEKRRVTLQRLEADKDLFVSGKVSAIRAKFNERKSSASNVASVNTGVTVGNERSDGITDDDEDVVY